MNAEDFYESCLGVDVSALWNLSEKKKNRIFRIVSGLGWKTQPRWMYLHGSTCKDAHLW